MNGVTEPCPWCRWATIKTRHLGQWAGVDMYAALCQTEGCGATGPTRDTEPAAIAAWNRRAPGWRPIETAPRDRKMVALIARYPDNRGWTDPWNSWWDTAMQIWPRWPHPFPPTHYAVIPTPPAGDAP